MELLNFIFRLGVVFAIYGFIWMLIELGLTLLSGGRERQLGEFYIIKAVKYFFLVNVTFLICANGTFRDFNTTSQLVFGTIVLLMYFIGRLQNSQNRQLLFQVAANGVLRNRSKFNFKAEVGVIVFALTMFILFWLFPSYANNPVSLWFEDSILNIEDTPIFGFIFKVIGFFFLLGILFRMVNSFMYLLSGKAFEKKQQSSNNQRDKDDFDSWEEVE